MSERIVSSGGSETTLTVRRAGDGWEVVRDGATQRVSVEFLGPEEAILDVGERRLHVYYLLDGTSLQLFHEGEVYAFEVAPKGARARGRGGDHTMAAPMPGVVLKLFVAPGDEVKKGAPLLILEAMKMEHPITAPYDGTVEAVRCSVGELVQPGIELIKLAEKRVSHDDEQEGEALQ